MKKVALTVTKIFMIVLGVTLAVLLLALSVFFTAKLLLLNDDRDNVAVNGGNDSETSKVDSEDVRLNILVMGKDDSSGLCDVLMLASYNLTDSSVGIVQIPRDTYAEYTSSSYKKLNGALSSLGSEREFCDFLEKTLCVRIDHYISLELDAVGEIVDALGGVQINVPCDMDYDDPAQDLSIHIKKGLNLLDGEMAEQFVRFRSGYASGDLGRIDAQKLFLAALLNRLRSNVSIIELGSLVAAVADDVNTSFPLGEVVTLARQALNVSPDNVRFVTLAGKSAVAKKSGASYYVISRSASIEILNDFFDADIDENNFDKDRLFLNERYSEFEDIYYSYADYKIFDATNLGAST